ncbi:hypothetical protein FOZ60_006176 [Perkinsus olseni]|uniref:Uncharacterized protein n=1 Tax=Perkinsus olseni TaxID=32597 RepID=A0A7J6NQH2_PEROL|nr:hypothetical protein FOZ60_006176 [Perkinsus olseni]
MKLILVFELLAVVEASTVGNELQLKPGVYVSDDKLLGDHNITMEVFEDQALQLRLETESDVITSPILKGYPRPDGSYHLKPPDGKLLKLGFFCRNVNKVLRRSVTSRDFSVLPQEGRLYLNVGIYRLRLVERSRAESSALAREKAAVLKRKSNGKDTALPKRLRSSSDQPSTSHGENTQLPSLVEKYSGHWDSNIGINLEISQDFSAKFEFTSLASEESKSTGWMRMERIVAEGEELSVLNDYTIGDMEVFDWASRMAGYKLSASPKLVNIFSPSGSGVEIFIDFAAKCEFTSLSSGESKVYWLDEDGESKCAEEEEFSVLNNYTIK